MKKNPFDMTKFNIAAGKMMEHLQRYEAVENPPFETILRGDIYETAKDLVFAFEHAEDDDAENIAPSRPPVKSEMPCNCKHEDTGNDEMLKDFRFAMMGARAMLAWLKKLTRTKELPLECEMDIISRLCIDGDGAIRRSEKYFKLPKVAFPEVYCPSFGDTDDKDTAQEKAVDELLAEIKECLLQNSWLVEWWQDILAIIPKMKG